MTTLTTTKTLKMLQFEKNPPTLTTLPPIKQPLPIIKSSTRSPLLIESHLNKHRAHIEVTLDRFEQLTRHSQAKNQPETNMQPLSSIERPSHNSSNTNLITRRLSALNLTQTPINFKWNTEKMPKMKLKKVDDESSGKVAASQEDRRRLVVYEHKRLIEEKSAAKNAREQKSIEYQSHSDEIRKKLRKRMAAADEASRNETGNMTYGQNYRYDIWGSDNFKDIALQKEVIKGFYETDNNRRIRYFRNNGREGFFEWRVNDAFDDCKRKLMPPPPPAQALIENTKLDVAN